MTTRKARQTYAVLSTTGLAVVLLGAWSAPALASSDISTPCPDLTAQSDASLHEMLNEDVTTPLVRTVDTNDSVALADAAVKSADADDDENEASEEATIRNTEMPAIATRLPGVSSTDLPRFRRQMFRTDI